MRPSITANTKIICVVALVSFNTFIIPQLSSVITNDLRTNINQYNYSNEDDVLILRHEIQNLRQQLNHLSEPEGSSAFEYRDKSRNNIIYGHIHIAKTGGTSLNGMLANKFERICGHKGYSYDAYKSNERAKKVFARTGTYRIREPGGRPYNRDRVHPGTMEEIGYEDCDYISHEIDASFWKRRFENGKFHETQMELHVPCRDPIDHLLSQCNMRGKELNCSLSTNEYLKSVQGCFIQLNRFKSSLQNNFEIKCFNFKEQFTTYIDYMGERLQDRRFQSEPYIKRETNRLRNKTKECLLQRPDLMDITREFLLKFDYYKFCDSCTGSKNDITLRH